MKCFICAGQTRKITCVWLNNAASTECGVETWQWWKTGTKALRLLAVMTNFLCCDLSEVSHEPPQGEKCSNRFHENPLHLPPKKQKTGETCCFNKRLVSWTGCLFGSLAEWVPPQIAGRLDSVFLWMLFWFVLTQAPGWVLKRSCFIAEGWADFALNSALSNIEIISTTFVSHSIFVLVSRVRWNLDFLITNDDNTWMLRRWLKFKAGTRKWRKGDLSLFPGLTFKHLWSWLEINDHK